MNYKPREERQVRPLEDKLGPGDVREMPYWVRHLLIHVVKYSATLVVKWCEQVQEAAKEANRLDRESNNR